MLFSTRRVTYRFLISIAACLIGVAVIAIGVTINSLRLGNSGAVLLDALVHRLIADSEDFRDLDGRPIHRSVDPDLDVHVVGLGTGWQLTETVGLVFEKVNILTISPALIVRNT